MAREYCITHGTVHGQCPKCDQPFLGEFDADETTVDLKCVSCGHVGYYRYVWPDDLPKFELKPRRSKDMR